MKREPLPAKEAEYQSEPKYCLLVFGPGAEGRVWLVLDGEVLYADRNGNGDLTEAGERFTVPRKELRTRIRLRLTAPDPNEPTTEMLDVRSYEVGGLAGIRGSPPRVSLEVEQWGTRYTFVRLLADGEVVQGAGRDAEGELRFAERPGVAPVIHFAGPLTIRPAKRQEFRAGKEVDFQAVVGSRGCGNGTFAALSHRSVPPNVHPAMAIAFPAKVHGKPVTTMVSLDQRC